MDKKPQITVCCENADEKTIKELKAELEQVIHEVRPPRGEWKPKLVAFGTCTLQGFECDCGRIVMQRENFCPDCGADMRGDNDD